MNDREPRGANRRPRTHPGPAATKATEERRWREAYFRDVKAGLIPPYQYPDPAPQPIEEK